MNILQNNALLAEYLPIAVFLGIATLISVVVIVLPKILAKEKPQKDKLSAYECGFEAFGDARGQFDIRFYLVAILFIIFDLEVAFLIPWAINLKAIGQLGFWSMMVFLLVLTIGFIYEWKKGALDWE
jgi:NADH-quinone oxidoreductase subunit A